MGFAERLIAWQATHGRHDLPWQSPRTPYRVWVSEIMLQQTQVATVIPYFERFVQRFPSVMELAAAELETVNRYWAGLGYYRRARFLHRAAQCIVRDRNGELPSTIDQWLTLPGIGRSTAAAIISQALDRPAAILDGNVKRVLARIHAVTGDLAREPAASRLWRLAEHALPDHSGASYTQAIMDLGATVCVPRTPRCPECPVSELCQAHALQRVADFPSPKLRKPPLPLRRMVWLKLLDARGRVFLLQRPPTGVWPSLWSLPEAESLPALLERYDLPQGVAYRCGEVRHVFSHFRLHAELHACQVADVMRVRDATSYWLASDDPQPPALPAPLKKILLARAPDES